MENLAAAETENQEKTSDPKKKNTRRYLIIGMNVLPALVGLAFYYARFIAPFESTDDAFIEAHVTTVSPQVAGRVDKVLVRDNQFVNAGDVLLQIEPSDYEAKLDQGRANLASAKAARAGRRPIQRGPSEDRARKSQCHRRRSGSQAGRGGFETLSSRRDFWRFGKPVGPRRDPGAFGCRECHGRSEQTIAAEAQVGLDQASIQTAAAEIKRSEAAVRQAELDLSYTQIKAHESGYVTRRTVEAGAYVQPGQSLLAMVAREVWVVANFKESQLTHMRAGQPVTVRVDAYPHLKLSGHVDSIQSGAGARFSLFPPENATGNYVKVVQRVPVKIVLDESGLAVRV